MDTNDTTQGKRNGETAKEYAARLQRQTRQASLDAANGGERQTLTPSDVGALEVLNGLPTTSGGGALARSGGAVIGSIVPTKITADEAAELMAELSDGSYSLSPTFIKLQPGDVIRGTLVGMSATEVTDPQDKSMKRVGTWILQDERGFQAQFLTAHQLDQELSIKNPQTGEVTPRLGEYVVIAKLADETIPGGRRVGRFRIAFKRDGGAGISRAVAQ